MNKIEEGHDWEAEKKRRLAHLRARKRAVVLSLVFNVATAAILFGILASFIWSAATFERRMKAARIEGRTGCDHATAMRLAAE